MFRVFRSLAKGLISSDKGFLNKRSLLRSSVEDTSLYLVSSFSYRVKKDQHTTETSTDGFETISTLRVMGPRDWNSLLRFLISLFVSSVLTSDVVNERHTEYQQVSGRDKYRGVHILFSLQERLTKGLSYPLTQFIV